MDIKTELELLGALDKELMDIIESKQNDYSRGEDVLSNFKRLSAAAKILNINVQTPEGYSLFMVLLKIDRINNLVTSGKEPSNESVSDSYKDGINYLKLSYLCYIDSLPKPTTDV